MPFVTPFLLPRLFRAPIRPQADGRFRFARGGETACLANIPDDLGYFGDCVAWMANNPGEWWMHERRLPILALPELTFAADVGCDVFVVEHPARWYELAWLGRWPGPCCAVLDWDARDSLRLWLSLVRGVQCETAELARAVEAVLRAAPVRQRLHIAVAEPAKPVPPAPRERAEFDPGTTLEPFPLREPDAAPCYVECEEAAT